MFLGRTSTRDSKQPSLPQTSHVTGWVVFTASAWIRPRGQLRGGHGLPSEPCFFRGGLGQRKAPVSLPHVSGGAWLRGPGPWGRHTPAAAEQGARRGRISGQRRPALPLPDCSGRSFQGQSKATRRWRGLGHKPKGLRPPASFWGLPCQRSVCPCLSACRLRAASRGREREGAPSPVENPSAVPELRGAWPGGGREGREPQHYSRTPTDGHPLRGPAEASDAEFTRRT